MGTAIAGAPTRAKARWLLPVSFTVALAFRLVGLGGSSMWLDEIMETLMARDGLRELFSALLFDRAQPPIEPMLTWVMLALDQGELARRLLNAVLGAVAVAVFARWVERRFDRPTAALAALFLATSPVLIRYSQELRPYALALLFSVWALDSSERWLARGARDFPIELVAAATLASMTHYLAVVLWLPVAAAWMEARVEGRAAPLNWRVPAACALSALPLASWFALLSVRGGPYVRFAGEPWSWEGVERRYEELLFLGFPGQEVIHGAALLVALLVAIGFVALARQRGGFTILVGLVGGTALVEAVLLATHRFSHVRYNLFGLLFLLTAIAAGIVVCSRLVGAFHRTSGIATGLILSGAVLAASVTGVVGYAQRGRPDWPAAARAVTVIGGSDAYVVTTNQWAQISLGYYLGRYVSLREAPRAISSVLNDGEVLRAEIARQPAGCVLVLDAGYPRRKHLLGGLRPRRPILSLPDTDGARFYRFAAPGIARQYCSRLGEVAVAPSRGYGHLLPWLVR